MDVVEDLRDFAQKQLPNMKTARVVPEHVAGLLLDNGHITRDQHETVKRETSLSEGLRVLTIDVLGAQLVETYQAFGKILMIHYPACAPPWKEKFRLAPVCKLLYVNLINSRS